MRIPVEPVWSSMQQRSWDTDIWVGSPDRHGERDRLARQHRLHHRPAAHDRLVHFLPGSMIGGRGRPRLGGGGSTLTLVTESPLSGTVE